MPAVEYKPTLLKKLRDLEYAAGYLTAAMDEGEDTFLLALRDVAQANAGLASLARATRLNRENLYDMLSEQGNPRLKSITAILEHLGLQVQFSAKARRKRAA